MCLMGEGWPLMAEIADDQLALLKRYESILNGLNANPKAKKHLETALKAVDPTIRTEEDIAMEYAAPVRDEVKALGEKFDTYLTEQAAETSGRRRPPRRRRPERQGQPSPRSRLHRRGP